MQEREFSTFEIGKICNVTHTSIINWINRKRLVAHVTPGGHRRVYLSDLVAFLKKYGMTIPEDLKKRQPCVLVVDDEQPVLDLIVYAFKEFAPEFKIRTTKNGVEALILIGKEKPDVVILDIIMPEMDGIQVCKKLRVAEDTKGIKIIAITGKNLLDSYSKFLEHNTDAFFQKPFSVVKLVKKTMECVRGRKIGALRAKR